MNLEDVALTFDLPIGSTEHALLEETAWMGGPLITVRFYLGRFLGRNLFRETDAEVEERLMQYISESTSEEGGNLVRDVGGWSVASDLLRYRFEMKTKGKSCIRRLHVAAIETFLGDPSLTLGQLAKQVGTTEKQLGRNSTLTMARKILATHS